MTDGLAQYESFKNDAWSAISEGDLPKALTILEQGLSWARTDASATIIDRLICNRASVLIELAEDKQVGADLKKILLKSADDENRFLAAFTLARAYDLAGDTDRALQFARTAHRHVEHLGADQQASSHNRLGNLLLVKNDFEGALQEFERAIAVLPDGDSLRRAIVLDNLGYCQAIRGRFKKAFRSLFASVRLCRRLRARRVEASALLALAYAYLQQGDAARALRHSARSLELAEQTRDRMTEKYGLFVLGEAHKQAGNPLAARECFRRLQEEFYPASAVVPELLLFLNVVNMINLKA